ncbi:MAG TPA: cytochrome b [Burkholderiaceae bacterium]
MSSPPTRSQGESARYTGVAIFLHWLSAFVIAGMLALGWYMTSVEDEPGSERWFGLHQSVGVLLAMLIAFRLVWRITHRPQPLPYTVPAWQAKAAHTLHALLYAAMIAMPLTGIAGAMLDKEGLTLFGQSVPRIFAVQHDLAENLFDVHGAIAAVLACMIGVHMLAAIKHLAIDKDGVFQRMWFRR